MKEKKGISSALILVVAVVVLIVAVLSGKTTVVSNTSTHFEQVGTRLSTIFSSSSTNSGSSTEEDDGRTALSAPANFTVDNDGNYSFDAVDNAEYYTIYVYADGSTAYDYITNTITGEGTITGSIADLNYPYGDYQVSVVAYPSYDSEELKASEEEFVSIKKTGEVTEPQFTFYWDCFAQQLQIIWLNSSAYSTTGSPLSMDVTLTGSETKNVTLEMDGSTTSYAITDAAVGEEYEVSLTVTFDENYVTNPTSELNLGSVTCSEDTNFAPEGYEYNGGLYSYADYPIAVTDFDLTNGGDLGSWKIYSSSSGMGMMGSGSTAEYLLYTAVPVAAESGDAYTYTFTAVNDDGSSVVTNNFGSLDALTGTLHLYEDGTFLMEMDSIYICTDQISGSKQYHNGSSIEGKWKDNGSGFADLAFNLGSEVDLGHE